MADMNDIIQYIENAKQANREAGELVSESINDFFHAANRQEEDEIVSKTYQNLDTLKKKVEDLKNIYQANASSLTSAEKMFVEREIEIQERALKAERKRLNQQTRDARKRMNIEMDELVSHVTSKTNLSIKQQQFMDELNHAATTGNKLELQSKFEAQEAFLRDERRAVDEYRRYIEKNEDKMTVAQRNAAKIRLRDMEQNLEVVETKVKKTMDECTDIINKSMSQSQSQLQSFIENFRDAVGKLHLSTAINQVKEDKKGTT